MNLRGNDKQLRRSVKTSSTNPNASDNASSAGFEMRVSGNKRLIDLGDIVYLKSAKNYTVFKLNNGREVISSRTLKTFEEELTGVVNFVRPHRSYMINFDYVSDIDLNCRGGEILLSNERLEISRRKAADFRRRYKKFLSLKENENQSQSAV